MQKRYDEDFKKTLVELYQSGQTVTDLSKEYGVAGTTLYKWIDLYAKDKQDGVSKAEFLSLKKQLARTREENDILKKVLTIFAEKKD